MKSRLFLVGLLTLVVLGIGGFYFFQLKTNQINPRISYNEFIGNSETQIVPMKDYTGRKAPSARTLKRRSSNKKSMLSDGTSSMLQDKRGRMGSAGVGDNDPQLSVNYFKHSEKRKYSRNGGVSGNLLVAGRSSSGNSKRNEVAGVSAPLRNFNRPLSSPPFTGGNNTIIIDPGVDPNPDNKIPVGDGVWILSILALAYGLKKKFL